MPSRSASIQSITGRYASLRVNDQVRVANRSQVKPQFKLRLGERTQWYYKTFRVAMMIGLVLFVAAGAFAQTSESGAIVGTVVQGSTPLPGVTVEVRSASLQGTRTDVTDAGGHFRFSLLPPGSYTVTATLSGFQHRHAEERRRRSEQDGHARSRDSARRHPSRSRSRALRRSST